METHRVNVITLFIQQTIYKWRLTESVCSHSSYNKQSSNGDSPSQCDPTLHTTNKLPMETHQVRVIPLFILQTIYKWRLTESVWSHSSVNKQSTNGDSPSQCDPSLHTTNNPQMETHRISVIPLFILQTNYKWRLTEAVWSHSSYYKQSTNGDSPSQCNPTLNTTNNLQMETHPVTMIPLFILQTIDKWRLTQSVWSSSSYYKQSTNGDSLSQCDPTLHTVNNLQMETHWVSVIPLFILQTIYKWSLTESVWSHTSYYKQSTNGDSPSQCDPPLHTTNNLQMETHWVSVIPLFIQQTIYKWRLTESGWSHSSYYKQTTNGDSPS